MSHGSPPPSEPPDTRGTLDATRPPPRASDRASTVLSVRSVPPSRARELLPNIQTAVEDLWRDFRAANTYAKYKLGVLLAWLALSALAVAIACPSSGPSNRIGAAFVLAGDADRPVFMIRNTSARAWTDVTIIFNDTYRAAVATLGPSKDMTFSTKQLIGPDGKPAPSNLVASDVEVRTKGGSARLMRGGKAL